MAREFGGLILSSISIENHMSTATAIIKNEGPRRSVSLCFPYRFEF
jgi:hypothetical protein